MITHFLIRASYPNYYMVKLYADHGREPFNRDIDDSQNTFEGNKPGTVVYYLKNDETAYEFPPRWYDMYCLLKSRDDQQKEYLRLLLSERFGQSLCDDGSFTPVAARDIEKLERIRLAFWRSCRDYVDENPLTDNEMLITTLTPGKFADNEISHKGRMLMDLTRNCYPVPDFCILTAKLFNQDEYREEMVRKAIRNLEIMTNTKLGDTRNPLVFAIRCAMPQYIPGLMPTILNIGVTRVAYEGLRTNHPTHMANRVYLSTLHSLCSMLKIEKRYTANDIELNVQDQFKRISELEEAIIICREDGERLINDAEYQASELIGYVRSFYLDNQDLILTFMQGKQAQPSFILQRMVWTIGNNESYPGVLYSRHSRGGKGKQIESYRNIFGEEIMTGDVTSEDTAYTNRQQIKHEFPAVFHFDPLLKKLESRYKSPVTIEFAVETRPRQLSLFSVLQLNISEMTGRAALISAIDLYKEKLIEQQHVVDIIKPYHLRQIVSASIGDDSISKLQFFGNGLSVLPRTAISAVLCFSSSTAKEMKQSGKTVCLCQERFVPEDTITLNEVDAIISLTPAAIHVVTACRGYGIPALMDLQNYGIHCEGNSLINEQGIKINEFDILTISSKRQAIYKGQADFRPARFTKYLNGESVTLSDDEKIFFAEMKEAYGTYQNIINSQKITSIGDIDKLARIIRCDLQDQPDKAHSIVNDWYNDNADLYVVQVLQSKMGSHQDQSRVFNLLDDKLKADFFHRVSRVCIEQKFSGLKAGSFMLGRFISKALPTAIWDMMNDQEVAFLLNEYVLYEKYLHVLEEVGEIKLARAHSRIETEGIDNMIIDNFDLYKFVPLLKSKHDWGKIANELELIEHQDNTHLLVEKLAKPLDQIFDISKPWVRIQVFGK